MSEVYWNLVSGFLTVTVVFTILLLVANFKPVKDKLFNITKISPPKEKTPLPFASAMILVGAAAILLTAIALILYIWMVPISSYEGLVQDRVHPVAGKGGSFIVYHVMIEGEKRKVSRDLFLSVKSGDHLRHPFAAPYFYHNNKLIPNMEVLWSLGFYGGICLYLFLGSSIYVLRSITPEDQVVAREY